MVTRHVTGVTLFLMMFLAVSMVFGQHPGMRSDEHGRMGQLNLSEEQRDQILIQKTKTEGQILPLETKLKTKHAELNELMIAVQPDQKSVNRKLDEIGSLQTEIQKKRFACRLAIRNLMTDEQKVWFDKMVGRKPGRRGFEGRPSLRMQGRRGRRDWMGHRLMGDRFHPVETETEEKAEH
jgi:Spy/CpxP family protein refolding chaperone